MVRTSGLIQKRDLLDVAGECFLVSCIVLTFACVFAVVMPLMLLQWLNRRRLLGPILLGALLGLSLLLVGCATIPNPVKAPAEPAIFRPVNPQYPLPH